MLAVAGVVFLGATLVLAVHLPDRDLGDPGDPFVVVRRICRDLQDAERVDAIQHAAEQESQQEHAALAGRAPLGAG